MATIQIREVPEDVYETMRRRARASGKSIQAYMLDQVERLAAMPTDDDLFAAADELTAPSGRRIDVAAVLTDLDRDRR